MSEPESIEIKQEIKSEPENHGEEGNATETGSPSKSNTVQSEAEENEACAPAIEGPHDQDETESDATSNAVEKQPEGSEGINSATEGTLDQAHDTPSGAPIRETSIKHEPVEHEQPTSADSEAPKPSSKKVQQDDVTGIITPPKGLYPPCDPWMEAYEKRKRERMQQMRERKAQVGMAKVEKTVVEDPEETEKNWRWHGSIYQLAHSQFPPLHVEKPEP